MATTRGAHLRLGLVAAGVVLTVVGVVRVASPAGTDFGTPTPSPSVAAASGAPADTTSVPPPASESAGPADPLPTDVAASAAADGPAPVPAAHTSTPPMTLPPSAPTPDRPVTVRFDRLGVSAEIDGVLSVNGVLQVPEDPQRVGWWMAGSLPGADVGTTVLDGHLDSATRGVGFFVHLRALDQGDSITVTTASGGTIGYAVEARQTYPKTAPLPAALFDRQGAPALVLVTCGGPFDDSSGTYDDNIVVTARPT
jgi:hypothetical protein